MNEQQALSKSNGFVDVGGLLGFFRLEEANYLVSTGHYEFHQTGWMGYVLRRKAAFAPVWRREQ